MVSKYIILGVNKQLSAAIHVKLDGYYTKIMNGVSLMPLWLCFPCIPVHPSAAIAFKSFPFGTLTEISPTALIPTETGHKCQHIGYEEFEPSSWPSDCAPNKEDWIRLNGKLCGEEDAYPQEFWNCADIAITAGATHITIIMSSASFSAFPSCSSKPQQSRVITRLPSPNTDLLSSSLLIRFCSHGNDNLVPCRRRT